MSHIVIVPNREKGKKTIMPNRSKFVKEGLKSVINAVDLSSIILDEKAMVAYKYMIAFEQAINSEEYEASKAKSRAKVREWKANQMIFIKGLKMQDVKKAINSQWQEMINYGKIPLFEILLNNGNYLVVDIEYTQGDDFISFSFDDSLPVFFDGDIKKHGSSYRVMLDDCFNNLDNYLELIHENILEGYILPNSLWCDE